ncbi:NtaA/DmoA family FMN-dependent monooxygenase [Sphingobium boeckii]|uniref:FMN-dependent oxidoreductase (Nitrilotriacetate monooxygenase family) n=1 Tax=Sphingobium boeckii TaxID=1082345 RepID=A0A7W9AHP1_9SPHN|nr:NtaA/DmoA family FMN-dependent monooxygenase [Sphingobium boeckii]MBB5685691.1 FMN-dependent oxidoreductase (nitrilotriacetate monooxygenase family) [Sphingobium boeckii]
MNKTKKPLSFGVIQGLAMSGMVTGIWAHPDNNSHNFLALNHWIDLARKLESGGIDFLFFADQFAYPLKNGTLAPRTVQDAVSFPMGDPVVLLSALAAATTHLGLVTTMSTMTEAPPHIARRLSTLDSLSGGRIGWNVVTGANQQSTTRIFGTALREHGERYAIADDFLELVLKFWEGSWEDGAVLNDKAGRVYADPAKVHEIKHQGPYFSAEGAMMVPPSPQRTPVLFQAGTSSAGRRFAAKFAEAVFISGSNPSKAIADITAIRTLAQEEFGRDPGSIKFMAGALFITGDTEAEARRRREEAASYSTMESAMLEWSYHTGMELTEADLDKPIPGQTNAVDAKSLVEKYAAGKGEQQQPQTIGEMLEHLRRNGPTGLGFTGTPEQIADEVEAFVDQTGVDGFLIEPFLTPSTYDDFVDGIMPALRKRGLAKSGYAGSTLREHLFGEGHARLGNDHIAASFRR